MIKTIYRLFFILFNTIYITNISFSQNYYLLPKYSFLELSRNFIGNSANKISQADYNKISRNESPFVVWKNIERNLSNIITPINILLGGELNNLLTEKARRYYSNNHNLCLMSNHQLAMISINELLNRTDYSMIDKLKESVSIKESLIDFYILQILDGRLKIFFHQEGAESLNIAESITNSNCIEYWRRNCFPLLRSSRSISPIKIKIYNWRDDLPITKWVENHIIFIENDRWGAIPINQGDSNSILLDFDFSQNGYLLLYKNIRKNRNSNNNEIIIKGSIYDNILNKYWRQNRIMTTNDRIFTFFSLNKKT